MRKLVAALVTCAAVTSPVLPSPARAEDPVVKHDDQDVQKKLDTLGKEVEALKQRVKKDEDKSLSKWLSIGGDYRFRIDYLRGDVADYYQFLGPTANPVLTPGYNTRNNTLMTNRFGLNIKAKATQDVTITSRLLMYKTFGMSNDTATNAGFFADRSFVFDGTIGHVPLGAQLYVDQVFATWNNIGGQPIWFSVGRRPSTGGSPTHVRQDGERPGSAGVPGLLVDYAFDGMTLGVAPEIEALPGSFAKLCYGRGFDAGYSSKSSLSDTDMLGVQVVAFDIDPLRIDAQWNHGFNIFDNPVTPSAQLGAIDWVGLNALSTLKNVGPGSLTVFGSGGLSFTAPNGKHALLPGGVDSGAGLLVNGPDTTSHTGWAVYAGARYDLPFGLKIGAEYNHGSEFWIPFTPAADDMWTSKLGARGNVYEGYLIQELPLAPIASFISKTFIRVGYQYYDFNNTGSNNWIGAPVSMSNLTASPFNAQLLPPVKSAHDVYATFEVRL